MNATTTATREFLTHLRAAGADVGHPVEGFFGPSSITWKTARESVTYLGGMRALLMQIAHPKVAQGVADHSNFREDSLGRLRRTLTATNAVTFGTREEAIKAMARIHAIHSRVRGELAEPPPDRSAHAYYANDPQLLWWVYATLVDSTIVAYEAFMPPLSAPEWEQFYDESKALARLFGIPDALIPRTLADFNAWMEVTIASDTIAVTPTAREVARALLRGSLFSRLASPLNYVLAAGMLPPKLREGFELRWDRPVRAGYAGLTRTIRAVAPRLPDVVRVIPVARCAERRCREARRG
ncbi:MAG TPA: oxygenase MpaB family protein [Ardenticatenaceae bacterium]|nr:oxygenase MpaB family protein [Ardenticatenaceae bacterium]